MGDLTLVKKSQGDLWLGWL